MLLLVRTDQVPRCRSMRDDTATICAELVAENLARKVHDPRIFDDEESAATRRAPIGVAHEQVGRRNGPRFIDL